MESMNKFKVLTIIILCMFIFAIAAMYSNTKDASKKDTAPKIDKTFRADTPENLNDLAVQFDALSRRVDELSSRVSSQNADTEDFKCKIFGTMSYDGIEKMPSDEAIEDAKNTGSTIVLTCTP